jgi:hypothetical protein
MVQKSEPSARDADSGTRGRPQRCAAHAGYNISCSNVHVSRKGISQSMNEFSSVPFPALTNKSLASNEKRRARARECPSVAIWAVGVIIDMRRKEIHGALIAVRILCLKGAARCTLQ